MIVNINRRMTLTTYASRTLAKKTRADNRNHVCISKHSSWLKQSATWMQVKQLLDRKWLFGRGRLNERPSVQMGIGKDTQNENQEIWQMMTDRTESNICSSREWLFWIQPCYLQACVDLRYQLSQAQLKRGEAERELRDLNTKTGRQMEKAAQVCLHSTHWFIYVYRSHRLASLGLKRALDTIRWFDHLPHSHRFLRKAVRL